MAAVGDAEDLWKKLQGATNCNSLLKKHLLPNVFKIFKTKTTKYGGILADCMRAGCENLDAPVGIYATDPDAYNVFAPIFNPLIKDLHQVQGLKHPEPDYGDEKIEFKHLDPKGEDILYTQLSVVRNFAGFPFLPLMSRAQLIQVEQMAAHALTLLDADLLLKGMYYPIWGMTPNTRQLLVDGKYLFYNNNKLLRDAGVYNEWPRCRGIFFNHHKTMIAWVNEEDHLKLISRQNNGNLREAYLRLTKAIQLISVQYKFEHKRGYGFLTLDPWNLGTTLSALMHVRLPRACGSPRFKVILNRFHLSAKHVPRLMPAPKKEKGPDLPDMEEPTVSEEPEEPEMIDMGLYEITNLRRFGSSEYQVIDEFRRGVEALMAEEKKMLAAELKEKERTMFNL